MHQHESQRQKMSNFIPAPESHWPCSSIGRATHRIMENAPDLESGQCGFESRRVIRCRFKSCHGLTFYHLFKIYLSRAEIQNLHEYALSSPLLHLSSSTVKHYFLDNMDILDVMIFFLHDGLPGSLLWTVVIKSSNNDKQAP